MTWRYHAMETLSKLLVYITGLWWGESTGIRWIPLTNSQWSRALVYWVLSWASCNINTRSFWDTLTHLWCYKQDKGLGSMCTLLQILNWTYGHVWVDLSVVKLFSWKIIIILYECPRASSINVTHKVQIQDTFLDSLCVIVALTGVCYYSAYGAITW